jgi:hypothetical protein
MSDPNAGAVSTRVPQAELNSELTRTLGGIWQRHAGGKPSDTTTEISSNSIKFVLNDAVSGIGSERAEGDDGSRSPNTTRYRNEATAAVRRITGRKVTAFVPKRDAKTDVASDTYVLERPRVTH